MHADPPDWNLCYLLESLPISSVDFSNILPVFDKIRLLIDSNAPDNRSRCCKRSILKIGLPLWMTCTYCLLIWCHWSTIRSPTGKSNPKEPPWNHFCTADVSTLFIFSRSNTCLCSFSKTYEFPFLQILWAVSSYQIIPGNSALGSKDSCLFWNLQETKWHMIMSANASSCCCRKLFIEPDRCFLSHLLKLTSLNHFYFDFAWVNFCQ